MPTQRNYYFCILSSPGHRFPGLLIQTPGALFARVINISLPARYVATSTTKPRIGPIIVFCSWQIPISGKLLFGRFRDLQLRLAGVFDFHSRDALQVLLIITEFDRPRKF